VNASRTALPATLLAACLTGFVTCPLLYIAIGALFQFSLAFSVIMLPPFLLGSGFLLWRFLAKPADTKPRILIQILGGLSLLSVAAFLFFISGFTLLTTFERFGLFCTFFLLASACCLPLVIKRDMALKQRLAQLPGSLSSGALGVILLIAVPAMLGFLLKKSAFI
jgi:peptidoglycan/LPS O-acetylase OafA/YrhL